MALSSLPLFHRVAGQRVVVVGEGEMAEAKRRLIARAGGIPCGETEAHHAKLAFVAMEDAGAAEQAALRLRRAGLMVNVADRPELCDFIVPSVLERDPVLIAVGTSGASAGLAKQLRLRLERLLPPSLGALASALAGARAAMRERWPDAGERRCALDAALAEGGALDPLRTQPREAVEQWLTAPESIARSGTFEIALTSDDPDDLTLRQARLLGEADLLLLDGDIPEAILARARADAARHSLPYEAVEAGVTVILRRQPDS